MAAPKLESQIISDFPAIFDEFRGNKFTLLWRGTRDGFGASAFHARCDGHGNTLTLIQDTNENVFGGFTPVAWEAREQAPYLKEDPSLKSFIFTLKNPAGFLQKKFPLQAAKQKEAVSCSASHCPDFNDIRVFSDADQKSGSSTMNFGCCYTNDTGQNRNSFFTGGLYFRLKEIEVFEITN
jgi:hypothetical protein